ncbi:cation diffusion facilitator family transporter [Sphingomonas sp. GC_Shp_3]|uniref:cation diffusion facilitator family transporter n=1 Tax=Sphingomonas sp. GC_Shp_3 TaxID=2937383 RepID=UPI00226A7E59|nr:cation diffusion facilitator family transporter [Sphingomonas sp. GC_Shp_3]
MSSSKQGESNLVIFAALAANLGIAVAKFIAAAISGSSSMLTEGFHSVVDSLNQVLLLYGQHRGKRPPDVDHPFGYGRELYFWSFVVAILIFAVGAGVSVYEGFVHIQEPEPLLDPLVNYIVLGVAFALEGTSWVLAMREFSADNRGRGWWSAIRRSKDPAGFIVLFEDSAALAGLVIAAAGVWASHHFDDPRIDGVASVLIGVLLGLIAMLLAREAKGLLIGEGADPAIVAEVRKIVDGYPAITSVNHVRTIHTAPDSVFVAISADFEDHVTMGDAETIIETIETDLKTRLPMLSSIYIRPEKRENAAMLPVDAPASGTA